MALFDKMGVAVGGDTLGGERGGDSATSSSSETFFGFLPLPGVFLLGGGAFLFLTGDS